MKKILTIVVPMYNTEKYLKRCIDSLVYDEKIVDLLEIIIVNDGSKDNSLNIAKEYEKKFNGTVIVIDKENGGHGSTINEGLKVATGKYFRVLDSDDWVNITDFSKFVCELKHLDVDLILTNYSRELIFSGEQIKVNYPEKIEYNHIYDLNKFNYDMLDGKYFYMATSTYKTQILKDIKLYLDEKTYYVDMEYNIFPITNISSFIYLDYDIYRYFIGRKDQSISAKSFVRNRKDHEKVIKRLLQFLDNAKLNANKKKYVVGIILQLLNTHYSIYCNTLIDDKSLRKVMKKEIKEFDFYLKNKYADIYNQALESYERIRFNSKTKFRYAVKSNYWLMKIALKFERKKKVNR